MHQITIEEAKEQLSELIEEAINGEEVVFIDDNKPVAKLTSIYTRRNKRQFGSAKGLIRIRDDFDTPIEDFEEYM